MTSKETGHRRPYGESPYSSYFESDRLMVPVAKFGDSLPKKTLGVGIATDEDAWFVPLEAIESSVEVKTSAGAVIIRSNEAGAYVESAPDSVRTIQTFYYSWSAFFPNTKS